MLSDQLRDIKILLAIFKSFLNIDCPYTYLGKFWFGLKLHVDDDKLNGGRSVGEFLPVLAKISASFGVGLMDNGDRATLPGVILGSSSMLLI